MKTKRSNPFRLDPTRSITTRLFFSRGITRIFSSLRGAIVNLIVNEDILGLKSDLPNIVLHEPTTNAEYTYASTQVNIVDKEMLNRIKQIQDSIDPSDIIKLEDEPHITVRYGLFDQPRMIDGVKSLIQGYGEVTAKVKDLSLFNTEEADVLKFAVESRQLREMNERLKLLPNYQTYDYNPHLTVAYLKKGTGQKYVTEQSTTTLTFDTLHYSESDGTKTPIALTPTDNKKWKYLSKANAVEEFDKWVEDKIKQTILSPTQANKWQNFIQKGFNKGAARAFDDTSKARKEIAKDSLRGVGFTEGRREQFIRQTLSKPTAINKLKLLQQRALSDVKGMANDLLTKAKRTLTDGLVKGLNPTDIALSLSKVLRISESRAKTIAFTELVRAHADGQLEAMEQLGVKEVGVAVEWSTTATPCKLCQPLEGIVLTIEEAKGMIPRHPRCCCAFSPANVGESEEEKQHQIRSKYRIDQAIAKSRRLSDQKDWKPYIPIARSRPKPTVNVLLDCDCSGMERFTKLLESVSTNDRE